MISSQKKLTRSLIALAVSGSLIISLLWWDSTRFECMWDSNVLMLQSDYSEILIAWPETSSASPYSEFYRKRGNSPTPRIAPLFPKLEWGSRFAIIPIYLLLLTYLAALLLAWLLLMNRLARQEARKEQSISKT
ncbi:MAG: hypothetical protein IZT59_08615 [Verrucomicrobia bacterium]|jgi:hypothetical protein|nr:hypothetical protein [Verrucomicrobiota bacterium]|tara:strand:- start:2209 stop:2610 length:402 start_codon:yes stop_codon:yes gene_type:complete